MNDLIECSLQECGVDGAHWPEPACCHAGGKQNRVLLGNAYIKITRGVVRPEEIEARAVGHGRGDGHNALVFCGHIGKCVGEDLGICGQAGRLCKAGLGIVRSQAVELLLAVERGLKAAALLRQHVQKHRMIGGLEKLEGLDQQRQVVPVDGAKVLQAELFKQNGWPKNALGGFFGTAYHLDGSLAAEALDQASGCLVQMLVVLVGHDPVEVAGNGAHIAIDGPLVVVEHHDQALGLLSDVVHRLERNAIGKCGVAGHGDHVFRAARQVAGHSHAQGCGKRGACVSCAEAIVLALGAQHEAVESTRLADSSKAVAPASENFVHISLVAHVEHDFVFGSVKDSVQRHRQLHHAQVRAQVAAGL